MSGVIGVDDNVMRDLRRGADQDDFVLEERAIAIVQLPKLRIEDFVKRFRLIRIVRTEPNHVSALIARNLGRVSELFQTARRKRFEYLFARIRRLSG